MRGNLESRCLLDGRALAEVVAFVAHAVADRARAVLPDATVAGHHLPDAAIVGNQSSETKHGTGSLSRLRVPPPPPPPLLSPPLCLAYLVTRHNSTSAGFLRREIRECGMGLGGKRQQIFTQYCAGRRERTLDVSRRHAHVHIVAHHIKSHQITSHESLCTHHEEYKQQPHKNGRTNAQIITVKVFETVQVSTSPAPVPTPHMEALPAPKSPWV